MAAMSDRLCAWTVSRLAFVAETEGLVSWKGDLRGKLEDGEVIDRWDAIRGADKLRVLAQAMVQPLEDVLELSVLDLKIDIVEWWGKALKEFFSVGAPPKTCTACGAASTRQCCGILGVASPVEEQQLWDRCPSGLCDACGSDLGLPSQPLVFCSSCRPLDKPGVAAGRAAGAPLSAGHAGAVATFGVARTNSEGITLTPLSVAGVPFMLVDLGDALPLPDDLCVALGLPLGSVEPNQCVLIGIAVAWRGWAAGPPELLGLPPRAEIVDLVQRLRRRIYVSAQAWQKVLGDPAFPIGAPLAELFMHTHDNKVGHDKDLHHPIALLHEAATGRVLHSLRTGPFNAVHMQVVEGPRGRRSEVGVDEGGILLHDSHVQAALPLSQAPCEAGWGPWQAGGPSRESPFRVLAQRLAAAESLLPAVATLDSSTILEVVDDPSLPRSLGP